jgi:ABC-type transport system substrate-binding protein
VSVRSGQRHDGLERIEPPDEKTVKFTTNRPNSLTLGIGGAAALIASSILPEEIAKDQSFMDRDLIGSGPFEFVSHENGANVKLKRHEKWRVAGEPYLAGVEYRVVQGQAAALAAFSAQELDRILAANKLEKDQLVQKHGKDITINSDLSRAIWTLHTRADGQWKDPRVIQAISLALDKDEMIQLLAFGDGKKSGIVPPAFAATSALPEKEVDETWGKFDAARARQMLTASGFDTSREYTLMYGSAFEPNAQFVQIVQSQLQKNLGLKLKLVPQDATRNNQAFQGGTFEFYAYVSGEQDLALNYTAGVIKTFPTGRPNPTGFIDDELDALWDKQRFNADDKQRNAELQTIQRKSWERGVPVIPTFVQVRHFATWNYLKGYNWPLGLYPLFNGKTWIDSRG